MENIKELLKTLERPVLPDTMCLECERTIPNKSFITLKGCIWCDILYNFRKI